MSTHDPCFVDELRTLFLFEKLSDEQLEWLCERGHVETVPAGPVYSTGDPADWLYILLGGTIALSQKVGDAEVETGRSDHRGAYSGAWSAFLGKGGPAQTLYNSSMRAVTEAQFFMLPAADFNEAMHEWFPMAVHLLEGVFYGGQRSRQMIEQRERLLALGSLSAGLTHELNNPAGAATRAAAELRTRVGGMRHKLAGIASGKLDRARLVDLVKFQEEAVEAVAGAPDLGPLEASDREDELMDWLDDHDISDGHVLAPVFVAAGLQTDFLDRVAGSLDDVQTLSGALRWLYYTVETELLMNEITDSTNRISTLLQAAKQYSQMDRAPFQVLDVRELLDSTVVMLSRKLGEGDVTVVREYDPDLPDIQGYGAELNQVWTNLIDNAVQAMDGNGTLTLRAHRKDESVVVEVADTGSGIPADVVPRIFEPFFTTKDVGQGTGLGLDISWRIVVNKHQGDLSVRSVPGNTVFIVELPIDGPQRDEVADPGDPGEGIQP
ncbi:ATP-binding protein [Tsukamurella ocularis]|uniref:ATP-binding protein n=1 Tax=Tsukamurella ocularis TaxID=1970234 RepID=UPI002166F879|nr:ATP-binding protein [Tsukamurella ocularis]MCS3781429.1 signal transduction histidine kinase [Tsukamurella ocularis]MCS3787801.1 signal transduction histidine kinase [Tsukamurella ocularis]MCS3851095.1 signal transduction histidine kinase [Tsukamurella ocularis]